MGANVQLPSDTGLNDTCALFSESTTRFLVELAPDKEAAFREALGSHPVCNLGRVQTEPRLQIAGESGGPLIDLDLDAVHAAFNSSFQG